MSNVKPQNLNISEDLERNLKCHKIYIKDTIDYIYNNLNYKTVSENSISLTMKDFDNVVFFTAEKLKDDIVIFLKNNKDFDFINYETFMNGKSGNHLGKFREEIIDLSNNNNNPCIGSSMYRAVVDIDKLKCILLKLIKNYKKMANDNIYKNYIMHSRFKNCTL